MWGSRGGLVAYKGCVLGYPHFAQEKSQLIMRIGEFEIKYQEERLAIYPSRAGIPTIIFLMAALAILLLSVSLGALPTTKAHKEEMVLWVWLGGALLLTVIITNLFRHPYIICDGPVGILFCGKKPICPLDSINCIRVHDDSCVDWTSYRISAVSGSGSPLCATMS
jgi:hypothetical protein